MLKDNFSFITDIALAVIAASVGASLKFSKLKLLGQSILTINLIFLCYGIAKDLGISPLLAKRKVLIVPETDTIREVLAKMLENPHTRSMYKDDVEDVVKRMIKTAIKKIPILNEAKRVVGDITMLDLLKHRSETNPIK